MTDARTIAETINRQIGLDTWLAVSGRNPRYWTNDNGDVTYSFRFGSSYGLPHWCEITYNVDSDLYTFDAYKIHRNGCKRNIELGGYEGEAYFTHVYADSLSSLVRSVNNAD